MSTPAIGATPAAVGPAALTTTGASIAASAVRTPVTRSVARVMAVTCTPSRIRAPSSRARRA